MVRSKILIGSLVAVTSLSAFVLTSTTASADDEPYSETYTKSALIRVQSACTLSGAEATPHTKTINPGTYQSNIGETVFSAVCNDAGGFAVYAIGYTGDTDGNNKLVHSTDSSKFINTGLAESGNDSAWAMKLTAVENDATPTIHGGYDNYSLVPDDYVKVASYPSVTTASTASLFKSYYAAYISLTQPAGIYNGQVKYVMVHPSSASPEVKPPEPYPTDPCISNPDCDATSGVTLQRAYELAYTAAHKGMYEETTAGSNIFQYVDSWNGGHYQGEGRDVRFLIQDMTPEICATATVLNSQALVLDIRDQSSYYIVKAADGRCWMQDNLALDAVATKNVLSPSNTNAAQAAIDNFITDSGTAPQTGWATMAVSYQINSNAYDQPYIYTSDKDVIPVDSLSTNGNWKIGVYYNYCAASVGTYCYDMDNGSDAYPSSAVDVKNDICPANWRMPTGGTYDAANGPDGGEYQILYNAYPAVEGGDNQYTRFRKAFHLPLSGRLYNGSDRRDQGSGTFVWSSTFYNQFVHVMYLLNASTSSINAQGNGSRFQGFSVRCVAKP